MQELLSSLGQVTAVMGAQWGDEGKGKTVDILAEKYDIIARACGGANAGHTIVIGDTKHVFHLLPSGCLHEGKPVVLGAGMVIHLPTLLAEIETLREAGIDIVERLHISPSAHILFDYHKEIDGALEEMRTKEKGEGIGTTKRGIGPAYFEKAARTGIRMEHLGVKAIAELTSKVGLIKDMFRVDIDIAAEAEVLNQAAKLLTARVFDTVEYLHTAHAEGKSILIEGAQATQLDLDHGTYPYVTSSFTTMAGALQGLGLAPKQLNSCIGIVKAYCTRVGGGPFPTEADEEPGQRLRDRGGEYGSTTGRPRRCGWLHIPDVKRAAQINGFTHLNITKLDVLDEEAEIPVGIDEKDGTPVYSNQAGWQSDTVGITKFAELPDNAQKYAEFVEEQAGVKVALIGTGPKRSQMIIRN